MGGGAHAFSRSSGHGRLLCDARRRHPRQGRGPREGLRPAGGAILGPHPDVADHPGQSRPAARARQDRTADDALCRQHDGRAQGCVPERRHHRLLLRHSPSPCSRYSSASAISGWCTSPDFPVWRFGRACSFSIIAAEFFTPFRRYAEQYHVKAEGQAAAKELDWYFDESGAATTDAGNGARSRLLSPAPSTLRIFLRPV